MREVEEEGVAAASVCLISVSGTWKGFRENTEQRPTLWLRLQHSMSRLTQGGIPTETSHAEIPGPRRERKEGLPGDVLSSPPRSP